MALSNLDRELLRDCLADDSDAWRGFCDRFIGLVIHVVYHTTNSWNIRISDETRDDLVSDVFVALLDKDFAVLRRFRGECSLATFLAVVARRIVLRRISQMKLKSEVRSLSEMDMEPESADNATMNYDNADLVEDSLAKLSSPEAAAIRMFHLEGKTYQEIGSHLGMPENSIGPFLSRARDKIRRSV